MFQNKKLWLSILLFSSIIMAIIGIISLIRGSTALGIVLLVVAIIAGISLSLERKTFAQDGPDIDSDPDHLIAQNYGREIAGANMAKNN